MELSEDQDVTSKPGAFVHVEHLEDGKIAVGVTVVNGFDPLALPSLMEHAYRVARVQAGLPPGAP